MLKEIFILSSDNEFNGNDIPLPVGMPTLQPRLESDIRNNIPHQPPTGMYLVLSYGFLHYNIIILII